MLRRMLRPLPVIAGFALLAVLLEGVAVAQSGILDTFRASEEGGHVVIAIDFVEPVRFLSDALSPSGTVLQVRITRLGTTEEEAGTAGRDRLVPTGPAGQLVKDISFEGGAASDGTVIVRFARPVRPTVRQKGDQQSLFILVPLVGEGPDNAGVPGASAEPTAPLMTPTHTAPATPVRPPAVSAGGAAVPLPSPTPSSTPGVEAGTMTKEMEEGRQAMVAKDYAAAVRLFTKVIQSGDPAFKQEAQELLGVAQERSNHLAHAKAEYEEYLRLYPTGEGADRVRQRLAALIGAAPQPEPGDTPRSAIAARQAVVKYLAGSLSQFFRRDSSISDVEGDVINQSYLASDLDVSGRLRTDRYDVRTQVSGGYRLDIEGSSSSSNLRLRYLYLDATQREYNLNARVGRQSRSTGGVLGRFDGALVNYRLTPRTRLNVVGGFPVDLSHQNAIDTDRYFYGASADFGTFAQYWDASGFFIQQQDQDLLDRRAVGGEVRYFRPEGSFFTLVDYDISYLALNILLMQGSYRFGNQATAGIVFDYRDTPALTTNNALIGQPVDSLSELEDLYDDNEIRDLAEDRTQRSRAVTLSGSYPLTDKVQLAADFTVAKLSSSPASGGVEAVPSTGEEYTISSQLIGSDIVWPGDVQIFGVRYADADITDTGSLMINSRFPFGDAWRLNPRFQFDLQGRDHGSTVTIVRPSFIVDYRWRRALTFELESGYEWVEEVAGSTGASRDGYYIYCGYRWDF